MSSSHEDSLQRAYQYAERYHRKLKEPPLGSGQDGVVLATSATTAIKALRHAETYERERNVYWRLQNRKIETIAGFNVPRLIRWSDSLLVIEMEIVRPPFVVDFAGARLDERPAWLQENAGEWEEIIRETFDGRDRADRVWEIVLAFRTLGIYLSDVKPGNVMFGDEHLRD